MIRNGLVASLVFTGYGPNREAKLVIYEEGQTTVTVIENFGSPY